MGAMKAHLEKQQSNLSALLDVIELFEFQNDGELLVNTESWAELRKIGNEMDAMLNATLSTTPTAVERVSPPKKFNFMRTELADGTVIGWDICGACGKHVTQCPCEEPTEPKYIKAFRVADAEKEKAESLVEFKATVQDALDKIVPDDQLPGQISVEDYCAVCGNETSEEAGGVWSELDGWTCASCPR